MSGVLTLICEHKRDYVAGRKKIPPPDRVEAAARETGDDVLVTAATRSLLTRSHELVSRGEVTVKGKSRPLGGWAPLTSSSWDTDTDGQAVLGA